MDAGNHFSRCQMNEGGESKEMLNNERCWEAVVNKDKGQDGQFVFGVITTGVYCRPSCPSRRPLRKNVRFYKIPAEAERAGLRPCRRCRPLADVGVDSVTARIRGLCNYIRGNSDSGDRLNLDELSRHAGLSPFHLQRSFKAIVGVTPRQYLEACRLKALKGKLRSRKSVTEAIYEAGFSSSSRVYERVDTRLGMTPTEYRARGRGLSISHVSVVTPGGLKK